MAEKSKKKSFVLYASQYESVKDLSDVQKATLFDSLFKYVITSEMPSIEDGEVRMAFKFIKGQIDIDQEKYDRICEKRREYGKLGGLAKGSISQQKEAKGSISNHVQASEADNDNDNDNDSHNNERDIPPKPPKGQESKKEKPLWKTSYEEWKRLFTEAKETLLNDSEFKARQEYYYPNIDYDKSIEKNADFWLQAEVWEKVSRERVQKILPLERMKKNFDKNKIYKSFEKNGEQKPDASYPRSVDELKEEDWSPNIEFFRIWLDKKCPKLYTKCVGFPNDDRQYQNMVSQTVGGFKMLGYITLVLERDGWEEYNDERGFMWIYKNYITANGLYKKPA